MRTDITLASWVSASLGNNYATPTLLDAIGSPLALNVLEQASMVAVALLVLQARRSALVNVAALKRSGGLTVLGMGMCNALTCRLFMLSLHHLPLSLCHTIRAASHLIDLGPAGGQRGGRIVATGTPEEVAANTDSATGPFLRTIVGT